MQVYFCRDLKKSKYCCFSTSFLGSIFDGSGEFHLKFSVLFCVSAPQNWVVQLVCFQGPVRNLSLHRFHRLQPLNTQTTGVETQTPNSEHSWHFKHPGTVHTHYRLWRYKAPAQPVPPPEKSWTPARGSHPGWGWLSDQSPLMFPKDKKQSY